MADSGAMFSDGDAYERLMGRWSRLVGEPFLDWLAVPAGRQWLDVGCGNGAFTELLIERCAPASVIAIDPSEAQIAYARERAGTRLAAYHVGDAQALPFDHASTDAAIMALVIAFLPDPGKAVREMTRVVRPGGMVAAYMWDVLGGGTPLNPISIALRSLGTEPKLMPGAPSSGLAAMQEFWQQAGLREIETRVIRIPVSYASFDDFWATSSLPVGPLGMMIQQMSADARYKLIARLREQLQTGPDGRVAFEAFANAVKGRVAA